MNEEHIEMLIDAIHNHDYNAPYIILLYIPSNDEYIPDFYFAVLAALRIPDEDELASIFEITKRDIGNMVYAAEHLIMLKDKAIEYLEELID